MAHPAMAPSPPLTGLDAGGLFKDIAREHAFIPLDIQGKLPNGLRGVLYRNGPGRFDVFGQKAAHLFDGDGMLRAFRIGAEGISASVRFIQTPGSVREQAAGKPLHVGYDTENIGLMQRLGGRPKNVANTNLLPWQGRLLAEWEGGLPTMIDPETLETLGESDLSGAVRSAFSAHHHRHPGRKTVYNFGTHVGARPMVDFFALPDDGPARRLCTVPVRYNTMIHDFAVTQNHLILCHAPVKMRHWRQLFGVGTIRHNFVYRPEDGVEVMVVPIDRPDEIVRFHTDAFWLWHTANAWENKDGTLTMVATWYKDFATNDWLSDMYHCRESDVNAPGFLSALHIDPKNKTLRREQLSDIPIEFPRVNHRTDTTHHRFTYGTAHASVADMRHGIQDLLAKIDAKDGASTLFTLGDGIIPSEPVFVADPAGSAEDDGWLLTIGYDIRAHRSGLFVLDARRVEDRPLAIAWYDGHMPVTFHGCFVERG